MRRLGVRPAELDDLCQEVFAVVFRRLSDYDPSRPIEPWLFGIAYRVMLDHHRKRSTHAEVPSARVPETPDPRGGPAEHASGSTSKPHCRR